MADEETMVIACTTLVWCALGVHIQNIKKQKHVVQVRDYFTETVFDTRRRVFW